MSVFELYRRLCLTARHHSYVALPIRADNGAFLALDSRGRPGLFVRSSVGVRGPFLKTASVSYYKGAEYELTFDDGKSKKEVFNALCCESQNTADIDCFIALLETFAKMQEGKPIGDQSLGDFFDSLRSLFATEALPDLRAARQGLWGELFCMKSMGGFSRWASHWHSEVTRKFDFSKEKMRIEVKTGLGPERIHHFSHRQIYSMVGESIVIASLMVREDDSGLSLRDLLKLAQEELVGTADYEKLEKAVRQAGMSKYDEDGPRFDEDEAVFQLKWFRSDDIPHFHLPEPLGVTQTQYKIDLSTAKALSTQELQNWLSLW